MQYYTCENKEITNQLEMGKFAFFPGKTNKAFIAALDFSKAIKNETISVHNHEQKLVGYAVNY